MSSKVGAQSRQPGSDHRPAYRCGERGASLGRPVRRALEDVFDLQDKVAVSVAGVIEPALQAAETARTAGRPTNDLTAYDLYLRAYELTLSSGPQIPEVLRLLEQTIERDPNYGPALALTANCYLRRCTDITAAVMPPVMYLRNPEHRELYLSGLRVAAGEAT